MSLTPELSSYREKYKHFKFERDDDGVMLVTMHTNDSDLVWGFDPDAECGFMLEDIGRDPENKVIILTGSGDTFIDREEFGTGDPNATVPASAWASVISASRRLLQSHLDVEAPMIAAINGPATIHAELALLCDIVLAADTAVLADQVHFPNGIVPGDGVQVIWPMLLGMNRGRYLMLTGQHLGAEEAREAGLVAEVMPRERLLERARELARQLLEQPPLTLRLTRALFTSQIKRAIGENVNFGLATEGLAATDSWIEEYRRGAVGGAG